MIPLEVYTVLKIIKYCNKILKLCNIDYSFTWKVICNAHNRKLARKILEAYFIATMKPSLNDQIDSDLLHLFRNGII